jgi:hypothetical protein
LKTPACAAVAFAKSLLLLGWLGAGDGGEGRQGKRFFFEKKNQKTFVASRGCR